MDAEFVRRRKPPWKWKFLRAAKPTTRLNEALADKAIAWINTEKSITPARPFFVYFAPGATHAPLQAPKAWIDKFKGKFDMGWDKYREIVFEQQKKLGVIPDDAKLTPRPKRFPRGTRSP